MLLLGWLEAWWGQTSWKESGHKNITAYPFLNKCLMYYYQLTATSTKYLPFNDGWNCFFMVSLHFYHKAVKQWCRHYCNPILHKRKLRIREVKKVAQGHTAHDRAGYETCLSPLFHIAYCRPSSTPTLNTSSLSVIRSWLFTETMNPIVADIF